VAGVGVCAGAELGQTTAAANAKKPDAIPVFMMLFMKPDYIRLLWTEEMGRKMSIGAVVLMLVGAYAIKKIVDIKV
jgi:hypothetical protein